MFHAMLFFLYHIKTKEHGMLRYISSQIMCSCILGVVALLKTQGPCIRHAVTVRCSWTSTIYCCYAVCIFLIVSPSTV